MDKTEHWEFEFLCAAYKLVGFAPFNSIHPAISYSRNMASGLSEISFLLRLFYLMIQFMMIEPYMEDELLMELRTKRPNTYSRTQKDAETRTIRFRSHELFSFSSLHLDTRSK